jgi:hypothetical protein
MFKATFVFVLTLGATSFVSAQENQEKPPDKYSERITIQGCSKGQSFITVEPTADRPVKTAIAAGRVFRLNGKKELMKDLKTHEGYVVEVTGLVKKSDLNAPQGIPIDKGGRVRVGGMPQNQDPNRVNPSSNAYYNVAMLDLESFTPLADRCPSK